MWALICYTSGQSCRYSITYAPNMHKWALGQLMCICLV